MGTSNSVPASDEYVDDLPYCPAELLLWLGAVDDGEKRNEATLARWARSGWNDLLPRGELIEAEILARRGHVRAGLEKCQSALTNILKQGSLGLLCLHYVYAGRLLRLAGDHDDARAHR